MKDAADYQAQVARPYKGAQLTRETALNCLGLSVRPAWARTTAHWRLSGVDGAWAILDCRRGRRRVLLEQVHLTRAGEKAYRRRIAAPPATGRAS